MGVYSLLKNKTFITATVIIVLIAVAAFYKKSAYKVPEAPKSLYEIQVYQPGSSGWGYRIYRKGTLYIQQENIPAVSGQRHFESQAQAAAVAESVKKKLLNGESPTITKEELQRLGIR